MPPPPTRTPIRSPGSSQKATAKAGFSMKATLWFQAPMTMSPLCNAKHLGKVGCVDPTTSWRLPILFRMMLTCRSSLLWLYKCKIKIHMDDIAAYSSPASEICLSYHFAGLFQFFLWILLCWSMPVLCTDEAYCNLNANCSSFSFCGNSCYLKKAGRQLVAMVLDKLSLCCARACF